MTVDADTREVFIPVEDNNPAEEQVEEEEPTYDDARVSPRGQLWLNINQFIFMAFCIFLVTSNIMTAFHFMGNPADFECPEHWCYIMIVGDDGECVVQTEDSICFMTECLGRAVGNYTCYYPKNSFDYYYADDWNSSGDDDDTSENYCSAISFDSDCINQILVYDIIIGFLSFSLLLIFAFLLMIVYLVSKSCIQHSFPAEEE